MGNTKTTHVWQLIFTACLLSGVTVIGTDSAPNLLPYDSSVSDYFRVTRANKAGKERKAPLDITLVMVGEHFINQLPYRSPVDRCVLAAGISAILSLNPKTVGVDFLFDKPTESYKDNLLKDLIAKNQDKLVVAVNATNDANINLPDAGKTEDGFSPKAVRASALLVKDADYVVRNGLLDDGGVPAFAAHLADGFGKTSARGAYGNIFQIDWLSRDSGREEIFPIIPFEMFLEPSVNKLCSVNLGLPSSNVLGYLKGNIENKIVIIGADLEREDRHITPFDTVWMDEVALSGTEIHANIAQQLIDGRHIGKIHRAVTFVALCCAFTISLWLPEKLYDSRGTRGFLLLLLGPVLLTTLLSAVNWIGIYWFGRVLPTGLIEFAIGASVLVELSRNTVRTICSRALDFRKSH